MFWFISRFFSRCLGGCCRSALRMLCAGDDAFNDLSAGEKHWLMIDGWELNGSTLCVERVEDFC